MATELVEERVTRLEDLTAEVWHAFAETDRQFKETDRRLERYFEHTDRELDRLSQEMRVTNKKWGDLSNKMGTLAEDLVAPSIPHILRTVVGCSEDQMDMMAIRLRRRHPVERDRTQEFDVVAVCGKYVLINETKSGLNAESVNDFVTLMTQARSFFPEYADPRFVFIGAIASLYVDESVARYGQKRGVLVLGLGDDLMDVLNEPGFKPTEF
jgi:hypothetical protein